AVPIETPGLGHFALSRNGSVVQANLTAATTTYADAGLNGSTLYSYVLTAYDTAADVSTPANTSATTPSGGPPTVPTGLTGAATIPLQNALSWTGSTDTGGPGLAGYKIYRAGTQIGTRTTTTYTDATPAGGTTYRYTVASYDTANVTSAQSTAVSVTTRTTYQITDSTGAVLTAAASLYSAGASCTTFMGKLLCTWTASQKYGSHLVVASIVKVDAACPTGNTATIVAGYTRPSTTSCEIDATPAVYGH
ncbi:MAG: hypothetical protein NTZ79_02950, partial [Proteobacteria bacterium]|nr:hypothetical protein [Pseudomonadota bacterium]